MMLLPTCDCRHPDKVAKVVEGLGFWRHCTDTAVVETRAGRSGVFQEIIARLHYRRGCRTMRIIPGLSTGTILLNCGRFDDYVGWRRIAEEVRLGLSHTGGQTFMLDHESAVEGLCRQPDGFSATLLTEAMQQLPTGVRYLVRPGPQMSHPALRKNVAVALAIASHVRDVRPFTSSWAGPGLADRPSYWLGHATMRLFSRNNMVAHLCCGPRGTRYWKYPDVADAIARLPWEIKMVTIFPGSLGWLPAAQYLAPILKRRFRTAPGP